MAREVARLLEADRRAGRRLEAAVALAATGVLQKPDGDRVAGRKVGPFELVRELGRGGMSTVYLARRPEGQLPREVALKVVRHELASPMLERRLLAETRILAGLVHPNIARLLDSGRTDEGSPYFVMEVIDGLPIDTYCDRHQLGIDARLHLFLAVCRAVDHAHRNLIVHRDLKPSNVLVNAAGEVKLLDFGIAKLLDPGEDLELTRSSLRLGTPGYASPEQIQGLPITTASDAYSLGVLLYQLLCGARPYRLKPSAPLRDIEAAIVGETPPPPSQVAAKAEPEVAACRGEKRETLARRLQGDLDTIVAVALRKEPERRYLSAARLAEDLERHLAGHPVGARADTFFYRSGKFLRRHRLAALAGAAVLLLSFTFVLTLWRQQAQTARERDRAERVSALLVSLFEVAEPSAHRPLTARELLDHGRDELSRLDDQPETQMVLRDTLAGLYEKLGLFTEARELLSRNLELQTRLFGRRQVATAELLYRLGRVTARGGDLGAAEPLFREALELRRDLLGDDSAEVAMSLNSLALVLHEKGALAQAEPLYRQAIEQSGRRLGENHSQTLKVRANLALLLLDGGDLAAAEPLFREALAGWRALPNEEEMVAEVLDGLSQTLLALDRAGEAEALASEALTLRRGLFGDEHPVTARSLAHLGDAICQRDPAAAEPLIEKARDLRRRLLGEDSAELAESLTIEAGLRARQGRRAEAEALYREAIATYLRSLPPEHPLAQRPRRGLAELAAGQGDSTP